MRGARTSHLTAAAAVGASAWWWRRHPSACLYGQRFWVEAPHPVITRDRLIGVLQPRPGQRILETRTTFDAAYLTAVLGEVPDQDAALRELARVLQPHGRLVVSELFGDPHFVSVGALTRRAEVAGLRAGQRVGPRFAYFASFSRD